MTAESTPPFPPYGVINDHYVDGLKEHPPYPTDWKGFPGDHRPLTEQWSDWKARTLDIIADVLWPRYIDGAWYGRSAAHMAVLTQTDFSLFPAIRAFLDQPVVPGSSTVHRLFFEDEDTQSKPIGSEHEYYDSTLPYRLMEKIPRVFATSALSKAGYAAPEFKAVLQRPRAYQISFLWGGGKTDFTVPRAISADSPSICSGHAYEGTMAAGGVIERFLLDREQLTDAQWYALRQFAVDIGDRRVMAGVHYPSDNLASWIMAMRNADLVFAHRDVKAKLWEAISTQSHVYRAVKAFSATADGSAYRPALEALREAAEGYFTS